MKYNFILEIDNISKDDINEFISVLANNHIKFHMLKSYKELKENQKYKEVINKAIEYLESKRVREKAIIDVDVLQGILKEVEHE